MARHTSPAAKSWNRPRPRWTSKQTLNRSLKNNTTLDEYLHIRNGKNCSAIFIFRNIEQPSFKVHSNKNTHGNKVNGIDLWTIRYQVAVPLYNTNLWTLKYHETLWTKAMRKLLLCKNSKQLVFIATAKRLNQIEWMTTQNDRGNNTYKTFHMLLLSFCHLGTRNCWFLKLNT